MQLWFTVETCDDNFPNRTPVSHENVVPAQKTVEAMKCLATRRNDQILPGDRGHAAMQSRFSREEYVESYCQLLEELVQGEAWG